MPTLKDRKRRGEEISKKYRAVSGKDPYIGAVDAISDILLAVAQTQEEANKILHSAEIEFRNMSEAESFLSEG